MTHETEQTDSRKLFRYADLVKIGVVNNRMTLKRWIESGDFPAPLRLGANTIAWRTEEVREWMDARKRVGA